MDVKNGLILFKKDRPDIHELRRTYIKEHRGFRDNPDEQDGFTFKEAARMAFLEK